MGRRRRFAITYAPEVSRHVDAIPRQFHSQIRRASQARLSLEPQVATRNRKPLEDQPGPFGSTWELRRSAANRFRVFYEVRADTREVWVLAAGLKDRDRLFFAGREFVP